MRRRGFTTLLGARPLVLGGAQGERSAGNARQHPLASSVELRFGGHAMETNGTGMRLAIRVLALGVSLLAIRTSLEAQSAAGISRVGWLEVCGPGPRRPHFDIFRARRRNKATSRGPAVEPRRQGM